MSTTTTTTAKPAAAKPTKPAEAKPAPKPAKPETVALTTSEKRLLVLNTLIAAGAKIAAGWDEKATGISKSEAIAILSNRLSYCGPRCEYPAPLSV